MTLPIRTIIMATDFSEASQDAVGHAVWMAKTLNAELKLLHVFEPNGWTVPSPYYFMAGFEEWLEASLEKTRQKGRELLKALAESLDIGAETIFAEGSTGKEIIRIATERNADLLILGTHGYTGWNHLTLGSIAEYVVRQSSCPVLTVKSNSWKKK